MVLDITLRTPGVGSHLFGACPDRGVHGAKNGRSGKTTPPKRRTTFLSFTSLFFTLIRFHSDTVQFNSKRDVNPKEVEGGRQHHQKGGGESSTTHQRQE